MGLFTESAIVRRRGAFPVKKYLEKLAGGSNSFSIVPEECMIRTSPKGAVVRFHENVCGHELLYL